MRYRIKIRYSREAVKPLQSWRFSCKLMSNLTFYGILNFSKNVSGSSNFRKIRASVLKLHKNIIYRSRIFGIKFGQNRLKRSIFLRFWLFWKFALIACANSEFSSWNFVLECTNTTLCFIQNLLRIGWGLQIFNLFECYNFSIVIFNLKNSMIHEAFSVRNPESINILP